MAEERKEKRRLQRKKRKSAIKVHKKIKLEKKISQDAEEVPNEDTKTVENNEEQVEPGKENPQGESQDMKLICKDCKTEFPFSKGKYCISLLCLQSTDIAYTIEPQLRMRLRNSYTK